MYLTWWNPAGVEVGVSSYKIKIHSIVFEYNYFNLASPFYYSALKTKARISNNKAISSQKRSTDLFIFTQYNVKRN